MVLAHHCVTFVVFMIHYICLYSYYKYVHLKGILVKFKKIPKGMIRLLTHHSNRLEKGLILCCC